MVNFSTVLVAAVALLPVGLAVPHKRADPVAGKYIVTLKKGVTLAEFSSHLGWVNATHKRGLSSYATGGIDKTFSIGNFCAYAGEFTSSTISEIKKSTQVAAVEQDQIWYLSDVQEPKRLQARALITQANAPWGLGTVSHRNNGSTSYVYDATVSGTRGLYAYIVDSGILRSHQQFGTRASWGYSAVGSTADDTYGHGTHIAGIIGGVTYGVARGASLVGVRVFEGETAATSTILDGFNWAVSDITSKGRKGKAVINMSLAGSFSEAFNNAVNAAYDQGIISVVAAGNDRRDASGYSPASAAKAVTVGAIESNWAHSRYSNWGSVVDIYAPGTNILSAWIGSNTATNNQTGTSMGVPHVTGLLLYLIARDGVTTPDPLVSKLKALGTAGKMTSVPPNSPNLILYNGSGA